MLHVADGSELIARRVGGPSVIVQRRRQALRARAAEARRRLAPDPADRRSRLPAGVLRPPRHELRPRRRAAHPDRHPRRLRHGLRALVGGRPVRIDAAAYDAARAERRRRLARRHSPPARRSSVPDARVMNAERALLVQNLTLTWRYCIGNPYEEFSFPEGDRRGRRCWPSAGFGDVSARDPAHLAHAARRPRTRAGRWARSCSAAATVRTGSRATALSPPRDAGAARLRRRARAQARAARAARARALLLRHPRPRLRPARAGGRLAGAARDGGVWAETGQPALAARARALAARLGTACAVPCAARQRRLADGSLFLPVRLLDGERPYAYGHPGARGQLLEPGRALRARRPGSSRPSSREARARSATCSRTARACSGSSAPAPTRSTAATPLSPTSGTDEVYGINASRFLADMDEPEQLVLSLYGQLAAGMTPDTFVAGEAPRRAAARRSGTARCTCPRTAPPTRLSRDAAADCRPRDGRRPRARLVDPARLARPGTADRGRGAADELRPGLLLDRAARHVLASTCRPRPPRPIDAALRLPGATTTARPARGRPRPCRQGGWRGPRCAVGSGAS